MRRSSTAPSPRWSSRAPPTTRCWPRASRRRRRPPSWRRARPDREAEPTITVKLERGGIGADQKVSEATFALPGALCACATVAEAVDGYAALCEVSPDEVRGEVLTFVRQSLARGLLVRA